MQLTFTHNDEPVALTVEPDGDGWRVGLPDGTQRHITARRLPGDMLEITDGARTFRVPTARTERGVELSWGGGTFAFQPADDRRPRRRRGERAKGSLTAPMAGIVADVLVTVGQVVGAYQPLAAIEAMKVYATVEAPTAGTVTAVHVRKGERVAHGAPVVGMVPTIEGEGGTP